MLIVIVMTVRLSIHCFVLVSRRSTPSGRGPVPKLPQSPAQAKSEVQHYTNSTTNVTNATNSPWRRTICSPTIYPAQRPARSPAQSPAQSPEKPRAQPKIACFCVYYWLLVCLFCVCPLPLPAIACVLRLSAAGPRRL